MSAREDVGLDLDALEAVAIAATPGPWEAGDTILWDDEVPQASVLAGSGPITWDDHSGDVFKPEDATHIAAFDPPAVLALIARVRAAEATIERVRELLDTPSDERGITWWSWIDGGLGGSLHDDLRKILEGSPS